MDQLGEIVIDPLKENISITQLSILHDSVKDRFSGQLLMIESEMELNREISQTYSIEHILEGEEISIDHLKICRRK